MSEDTQQLALVALTVVALAFVVRDCGIKLKSLDKIPNAPHMEAIK